MCTAIKEMIEEGRKEGMRRGRKNGLKDGKQMEKNRIVRRMCQNKMPEKEICRIAGCSREFVQKARQNKFEQMRYLK